MKRQEIINQEPTIKPAFISLIEKGFYQEFPVPVLVINALNIKDGDTFSANDIERFQEMTVSALKYADMITLPVAPLGHLAKLQN